MKLESVILPLCPDHDTAPPSVALFFSNVELIIAPFVAPSAQPIAPPCSEALLLINLEFLKAVLLQVPKSEASK